MKQLNSFIGIPFVDGGRSYEGCDCWGLVMLYFKDVLGIELPDYKISAEEFDRIRAKMTAEMQREEWILLSEPKVNSIALMKLGDSKGINHAAILLPDGRLLQAYENTGSHCVSTSNPVWTRLIKHWVIPREGTQ
jgi:murein DD-endopeptidase